MTFCSNCGAKQQDGAKFCTEGGAPIRKELAPAQEIMPAEPYHVIQHEVQPRKKKSLLRRWWVWVLVVVVIVAVVGKRGGRKKPQTVSLQPETVATAKPAPTAKPVPTASPIQQPSPTPKAESTEAPAATTVAENVVRPEVKEFLDAYEAYMDEYVEFMKKYMNADPTNMVAMMGDYYKMLDSYTEYAEKIDSMDESDLTNAELAYYLEVTNRVSQKLLTVGMD